MSYCWFSLLRMQWNGIILPRRMGLCGVDGPWPWTVVWWGKKYCKWVYSRIWELLPEAVTNSVFCAFLYITLRAHHVCLEAAAWLWPSESPNLGTLTLGCLAALMSVYFFKKIVFVVALFLEHGKIKEGCNAVKGDCRLLAHTMQHSWEPGCVTSGWPGPVPHGRE